MGEEERGGEAGEDVHHARGAEAEVDERGDASLVHRPRQAAPPRGDQRVDDRAGQAGEEEEHGVSGAVRVRQRRKP